MLIRLYSDTCLIDPVSFHAGINIILGKYSEDKQARGINGIGKSSLVRLIDFTLLSGKAEKRFSGIVNKVYLIDCFALTSTS